ncbi:MAG: hypothetical protein RSA66_09185 [Muribaculaceae bacterium]
MIGIVMLMTVLVGCSDHGEFVTNVTPIYISYDTTFQQWDMTKSSFTYDIHQKDGYYIAVIKESDGFERNGIEYRIERNPYYRQNHPTGEYQFSVQNRYFNFFLLNSTQEHDDQSVSEVSTSEPAEVQPYSNVDMTSLDSEDSDMSQQSGRSIAQIDADIDKTQRLLESNRESLQRLEESNSSVTLWPQYQRMIQQCEDRLEKLYQERYSAQY